MKPRNPWSECAAFQHSYGWLASVVVSSIILSVISSETNKTHAASAENTSLVSSKLFYV